MYTPKSKIYKALMTQTGTAHPIAIVLENSIGDIVWQRAAEGQYQGTLLNAFPTDRTLVTMYNNMGDQTTDLQALPDSENTVTITLNYGGVADDGWLSNTPIEITTYREN